MPPFPLSIWHQVKVWWYGTYHRNKNCTRMLPLPYYWMKAPLVLLCLLLWDGSAQAWSTAKPHCTDHTGQGASNRQRSLVSSTALEAQEEPKRDVSTLIEWAAFNGVETTNLSLEEADSLDGCVGVTASVDTPPMTNVLKVPSSLQRSDFLFSLSPLSFSPLKGFNKSLKLISDMPQILPYSTSNRRNIGRNCRNFSCLSRC